MANAIQLKYAVRVVMYKNNYFLWLNQYDHTERAFLLDVEGNKFSGSPSFDKLKVLEEAKYIYHCKMYNRGIYFKTPKLGVFSAITGKRVTAKGILEIFNN